MGSEVVGFLGLGEMGGPMAENLVRAGFEVVAYDTDAGRLEEARSAGIRAAASCRAVAEVSPRLVISIVRNAVQSQAAILGPEGMAAGSHPGQCLLVMSTLDPSEVDRIAQLLGEQGVAVIDAPVSGGRAGAVAGTLSIMAAGPPEELERARAVLEVFGRITVLGDRPGLGQAAKLANQMMLAVAMLGTFEGLQMARQYGVDESTLLSVLSASTGSSWVVQNWELVRGFWEGYRPGGTLDIIYKDLRSVMAEAGDKRLSLPVTAVAFHRLLQAWKDFA